MLGYLLLTLLLIVSIHCRISPHQARCPTKCACDLDGNGRRRVICEKGYLTEIPTHSMDSTTQVLIIRGAPERANNITIGRIFLEMKALEEITITHSSIPAIGDSSFWPGTALKLLNLSYNKISIIKDSDFNGLTNLQILNLNKNELSIAPSAPFRFLTNLTHLSLARNSLTKLVPRLFFKLGKLESLDLSENPLSDIQSDHVRDIKQLKYLYLAGCRLSRLHSLVYQSLPNLIVLDLRDNQFSSLLSQEFQPLTSLKVLLLDGNHLTTIVDNTFSGHGLKQLGLSRNGLTSLSICAFCNLSVINLDISRNKLTKVFPGLFKSLAQSLKTLNVEGNRIGVNGAYNLIEPLTSLQILTLTNTGLDDSIRTDLFTKLGKTLTSLVVSENSFVNMSHLLLEPLVSLRQLDLSRNKMRELSYEVLNVFRSMPLTHIGLHGNPWLCYRCTIMPLLDWINEKPEAYQSVCLNGDGFCVTCEEPAAIRGKPLHLVDRIQLEWCIDPTVQLRVAASPPRVGLVLAIIIIVTLVVVIIVVIFIYRTRGAVYYTHEEERPDDKTLSTIQKIANAMASPPVSPPGLSTSSSSPPMSPPSMVLPAITVPIKRCSFSETEEEMRAKVRI